MDTDLTYIAGKLQEGDNDTYVLLFRKYYVPLCAYARRYVGRKDISEEIVSETFFHMWRNHANLEIRSSVKAYLFQAVCNNSLNYLRKLKKEEKLEDFFREPSSGNIGFAVTSEDIPSDSLILKDMSEIIFKAVKLLPSQQQTVFMLRRFEGRKMSEISEIMGISIKTTEMHLSKALVTLRKSLKEYLPGFLLLLLLKDIL